MLSYKRIFLKNNVKIVFTQARNSFELLQILAALKISNFCTNKIINFLQFVKRHTKLANNRNEINKFMEITPLRGIHECNSVNSRKGSADNLIAKNRKGRNETERDARIRRVRPFNANRIKCSGFAAN